VAGPSPPYSLALRLVLYALPPLLALPCSLLPPPAGPALAAALLPALALALRLVARAAGPAPAGGEGEEGGLAWDGVRGPGTWAALSPPRHWAAGLILQVTQEEMMKEREEERQRRGRKN
jgi:hypothetical protein